MTKYKPVFIAIICALLLIGALYVKERILGKGISQQPIRNTSVLTTHSTVEGVNISTPAGIQIVSINNRGDKRILPTALGVKATRDIKKGEQLVGVMKYDGVIKNDLGKFQFCYNYLDQEFCPGIAYNLVNVGDLSGGIGIFSRGAGFIFGYSIRPSVAVLLGVVSPYSYIPDIQLTFGVGFRL